MKKMTILLLAASVFLSASELPAQVPQQHQFYSIQFASLPMVQKEKGLAIYEQLKAKGYMVYFYKAEVNKTSWMRLKAGIFPTVSQAKEFGARFKQQEGFDFFVANADVRFYPSDTEPRIIITPNALWMTDKTGTSELLLFRSESIEAVDALERIETTVSPDGSHLVCRLDSRQYAIQLEAPQPAAGPAEKDIQADAGEAKTLYEQGFDYYKKQNLKQAEVYFDRALALDPQMVSAYYYRGVVQYRQGRYDQAIADCTGALKLNPLHAEAYNLRALVWLVKGEIDNAIKDCDQVLKIDPQNIAAYSTLGVAWLQKGELEWACSDLRKACDLGRCETLETVKTQGYCQ